jgi:NAD(P)-dependent dehydrogenase (short-subunit alcohol dehydrogenase family)
VGVPEHPDRRPAVVTGASSGLGRAIAVALGAAGHPVALGARRRGRLEEAVEEIRTAGGEAVALPLDLHDGASVERFAKEAEAVQGPTEVLVSCAGDVQPGDVVDMPPEDFLRQLEVNLLGPQRLLHHLVAGMVERRRGDVVLVSSESADSPWPHIAGYVTAKSGLEGLARAAAMELEGTGVRVGVIRPGRAATEQASTWSERDLLERMAAWSRWGLLRHAGLLHGPEVAAAVLAMVSMPRGSHISLLEVVPEAPVNEEGTT